MGRGPGWEKVGQDWFRGPWEAQEQVQSRRGWA